MMTYRNALCRIASIATAVALTATMAGAQAKMEKMEKMDKKMDKMEMKDEIAKMPWGPGPDFLPKGAKMHVVSGNPGAAGPFVLHLMFPNGYTVKPHMHPADETVKVVAGHFHYGMGDKMNRKTMKTLKKGEEGTLPAKMNHYAAAQGRTVIELSSTGPFAITYVNAKDDPRNMGMKK